MTINIISKQINKTKITGPKKVLSNTLKGFDKLGIQYVFNQPINEYDYNWIHDDQKAIIEAGFIGKPVIVGPNTAVFPEDLPLFRKKLRNESLYLHPSEWAADIWEILGFDETNLVAWPAGIDTEAFVPYDRSTSNSILVYFKGRDIQLLENTISILKEIGLKYTVLEYGFYQESDYIKALHEAMFGIWIGKAESQGIALQEALSTNLPLIVLDASSMMDSAGSNTFLNSIPKQIKNAPATAAPYFDEECGVIIYSISEMKEAILSMKSSYNNYNPRQYILEKLSLQKSAQILINHLQNLKSTKFKNHNYQKISKILFFLGLPFKRWFWQLMINKVRL